MAGSPQFNNQSIITAVASEKIILLDLSFSDTLGVAAQRQIDVYSPPGTISQVVGFRATYPGRSGADAGFRRILIGAANLEIAILDASCTKKTAALSYSFGEWTKKDSSGEIPLTNVRPDDLTAQFLATDKMWFDEDSALSIKISNNMDVGDDGVKKTIVLWVRETKVQE